MKTLPILIQDTREQLPFRFDAEKVRVEVACLPAGDYSVKGYECRVAVERKSLEDLVGTVIRAKGRFERELDKLVECDRAWIVVEGSLTDLHEHHFRSMVHPSAVIGSCVAIAVDYGIPVLWADDAEKAADLTQRLLIRYHDNAMRDARQSEMAFPQATGE